jgi:hypothetical protein
MSKSLQKKIKNFSMGDADPASLPLDPGPLFERPLAVGNSMSGFTCTSARQEAKSAGVARPPRRPERPLTRTYWYLLLFFYSIGFFNHNYFTHIKVVIGEFLTGRGPYISS